MKTKVLLNGQPVDEGRKFTIRNKNVSQLVRAALARGELK
ncbi:hypothetical protein FACS1894217_11780 [Clostridia bacterium]|nr:hypothetical protein FACS1894217_11780 [Clostridia bacterium]